MSAISSQWANKEKWLLDRSRRALEPGSIAKSEGLDGGGHEDCFRENNMQLCPNYYRYDRQKKHDGFCPGLILDPFFEDYRRVLSSFPFRRQNNKTQVFTFDKEDATRTRLTHSYEVAVNAASIYTEFLFRHGVSPSNEGDDESSDNDVSLDFTDSLRYALMAACLLHDVGNPPFGHTGEAIIRSWFTSKESEEQKHEVSLDGINADVSEGILEGLSSQQKGDLISFEGNANSLRIALGSSCLPDGRRLNLTATTIAALVKYPYAVTEKAETENQNAKNTGYRGKYNYFQSEIDVIKSMSVQDGAQINSATRLDEGRRHPLSFFLEAADDISYATSDFEDAFRKRMFSVGDVVNLMLNELQRSSLDRDKFNDYERCANSTFTLICLLAMLAGSEDDRRHCLEFAKVNNYGFRWKFLNKAPLTRGEFQPTAHYCDFIAKRADDSSSIAIEHSFSEAFEEVFAGTNPTYDDVHQLQETYISRWVGIVRDWLCFSSAASLMGELKNLVDMDYRFSDVNVDASLFGNHYITVLALKRVMSYYVYDSRESLNKNARANVVLSALLDKFVVSSAQCAKLNIDPASLKSKDSGQEGANQEDSRIDATAKNTIRLIPLKYRLDCRGRLSEAKNLGDIKYDYIMMALDYISGLSDEEAYYVYQTVCS